MGRRLIKPYEYNGIQFIEPVKHYVNSYGPYKDEWQLDVDENAEDAQYVDMVNIINDYLSQRLSCDGHRLYTFSLGLDASKTLYDISTKKAVGRFNSCFYKPMIKALETNNSKCSYYVLAQLLLDLDLIYKYGNKLLIIAYCEAYVILNAYVSLFGYGKKPTNQELVQVWKDSIMHQNISLVNHRNQNHNWEGFVTQKIFNI